MNMAWVDAIASAWPGAYGFIIRSRLLSRRLGAFGRGSFVDRGCVFSTPENIFFGAGVLCGQRAFFGASGGRIEVGDRVSFNTNVHINAEVGGSIIIGDFCLIGPNVVIRSADHRFDRLDIPIRDQGHVCNDIVIESDVWLGANVVVVTGVHIGHGAVVAAGAVVTHDVAPMSVIGGVPAKPIKSRAATGRP